MTAEYVRRYVDDLLDDAMEELPAFMIMGPRACGKTTTALRRAASVVRLDDPQQAALFRSQIDPQLARMTPPILIDEWQQVPESLSAVKRAVDAGSGGGRFLITGSVRARVKVATWPGTGRFIPVHMHGLARGEVEGSAGASTFVERLFSGDLPFGILDGAPLVADYAEMAAAGGFPEAIGLPPARRTLWYDGYVTQLAGRDVEELADLRRPQLMVKLLEVAALNTAGTPSLHSLAEAAGTTHRTVSGYLDLLEELGIVERLPAWGANRLKRLIKTPKLHLTDTGMAVYLARVNAERLLIDPDLRGRIFESFVLAQLRPLFRLGSSIHPYHLRDRDNRREVDLVLEGARGAIVGIEVKSAGAVERRDGRHLAWLRDQIGEDFRRGVVFHSGAQAYEMEDRIWALPISAIWS